VRLLRLVSWFGASLFAASLSASAATPQQQHTTGVCTLRAMEEAPESVELPCTQRLQNPKLTPKQRAEAFFVRGRGRHRTGSIDAAAEDYEEAIALNPRESEFYVSRANTKFRAKDEPSGVADLETALRLDARNARALAVFGTLMVGRGQAEDGLGMLDKALTIDPKQPFALLFRAEANAGLGRWREAFRDADRLIALPPRQINRAGYVNEEGSLLDFHIVALGLRAWLHEGSGRPDRAGADLDAGVSYRPSIQAYQARASFLSRQKGREIDALRDWDILTSIAPNVSTYRYNRGLMLMRLQRFPEAVASFNHALDIDPEDGLAYQQRGDALRELSRFDEAFESFANAILHDPSLMSRHLGRLEKAGYYADRKRPETLTPLLRDALKACSLDPDCRTP
jgi:tetratricopeptide (TPR) repeat protein